MQWIELASGSLQETSGQLLCVRRREERMHDSDIKAIEIGSGIVLTLSGSVIVTASGTKNLNAEWDALKALLAEGHTFITQEMIQVAAKKTKVSAIEDSAITPEYVPLEVRELAIEEYFPTELKMPSSAMPTRATMVLRRNGIVTITLLLMCSAEELLQIKHFGPTSLAIIEKRLAFYGLKLKDS